MENESLLDRINGLLVKAQHPGTGQAEAEALTAKATYLMEKYSIKEAILSARTNVSNKPMSASIVVSGTYITSNQQLVAFIARAFGAHCVFMSEFNKSTLDYEDVVKVYGYESDIEMIRLLYTSLTLQCANQVKNIKGSSAGETRHLRRSFILGFAYQVGERLLAQRKTATVEAEDSTPGAALVLVDRSTLARKLLDTEHPRLRKIKPRTVSSRAYNQGKQAGARADLHNTSNVGQRSRVAIS